MNKFACEAVPGRMAKLLAVLSLACFWLLPFSPIVSIAAVSMTGGTSGWSQKLAVTGAALCIAYTITLAFIVLGVYVQIRA